MLTTGDRFVVTHAGSLPRPTELAALHGRRSRGEDVDPAELRADLRLVAGFRPLAFPTVPDRSVVVPMFQPRP